VVHSIVKQILGGLIFLHDECAIIHTDLKPESFLIEGPTYDMTVLETEREEIKAARTQKEVDRKQEERRAEIEKMKQSMPSIGGASEARGETPDSVMRCLPQLRSSRESPTVSRTHSMSTAVSSARCRGLSYSRSMPALVHAPHGRHLRLIMASSTSITCSRASARLIDSVSSRASIEVTRR
jgi:serine/threonine protein kinase